MVIHCRKRGFTEIYAKFHGPIPLKPYTDSHDLGFLQITCIFVKSLSLSYACAFQDVCSVFHNLKGS